jgi:hypothetical protein
MQADKADRALSAAAAAVWAPWAHHLPQVMAAMVCPLLSPMV